MPLWTVSPIFQSGTALVAQLPDSATAGGNARGANATDFQTSRSAATMVASGQFATIGGGNANTASGQGATVGGGQNNVASGANATVGGGGNSNTASGVAATVAGGASNTASASHSTVAGGQNNRSNSDQSWVPGGSNGNTRTLLGIGAWAAGSFVSQGDAQREEHILRRQTTDATATRLTANNAVPGTTNTINLQDFSLIAGRLVVEGRAAGGANLAAVWFLDVSATRDSGAGSVLITGGGGTSIAPTHSRGLGSAWRIDVTADTTNGGIAVTVTGAAATTINWVAGFIAIQVATAS